MMNAQTALDLSPLHSRIEYLERNRRFVQNALEWAMSLGNFQESIYDGAPARILEETERRIGTLIPFQARAFYLINEETSDLELAVCSPRESLDVIHDEVEFMIDNGFFAWALRENREVILSSQDRDREFLLHALSTSSRIRGMFVGLLPKGRSRVPDVSLSLLSIILLNTANALESHELYRMIRDQNQVLEQKVEKRTRLLEFQSLHDSLTGLANRNAMIKQLDKRIPTTESGDKASLLLLDLDNFKDVNFTFGHREGNRILVETAARLKTLFPKKDAFLARLGGDEFAMLLSGRSNTDLLSEAPKQIIKSIHKPFHVNGQHIELGASMGVVLLPDHGRDSRTALARADAAIYAAKQKQIGYAVYEPWMDNAGLANLRFLREMRRALDLGDEFQLHYQPKVDLATGRLHGVEALMRWKSRKLGQVSPVQFIPLAERGGLIKRLTRVVLDLALRQGLEWLDKGFRIPIAVNLSMLNLQDPEMSQVIRELLEERQYPVNMLHVEITESVVMTAPKQGMKTIEFLNSLGIKLFIDDFGTGYSSLAYLRSLPVQALKIDASFVKDMENDKSAEGIVRTIVDLGHNLGLEVVAEGVENRECLDKLRELGCDTVQGYHISRPAPGPDFLVWLEAKKGSGSVKKQ